MPFIRPTLSALIERGLSSLRAATEKPILRVSNLGSAAETMAGLVDGTYAYQAWVARQILVDTAEMEVLERHARIWGVSRVAATMATGTLSATGTTGIVVPSGTTLTRADGVQVVTTASATFVAGVATLPVRAVVSGASGNAETDTEYRLVTAISGVTAAATVIAPGLAGGAAAESDGALRARVLARIRTPPQGGASHDYVAWALTVAGVTRAWTLPLQSGLGTVGVAIAADDAVDGPIPSAGLVELVQAAIEPLRPVTADVTVFAPTALVSNIEIEGLSPDTPEVRAAVELELQDLFRRAGDLGVVLPVSQIWEAVSLAAGERRHKITAPAADITPTAVQLPVLGTVSFVDE